MKIRPIVLSVAIAVAIALTLGAAERSGELNLVEEGKRPTHLHSGRAASRHRHGCAGDRRRGADQRGGDQVEGVRTDHPDDRRDGELGEGRRSAGADRDA